MSNKIRKIGVLTSGGDSPGMNAAIRSVVRTCAFHNIGCVGIYRGYQGMIEGDFKEMGPRSVNNIINKGGTILKSAQVLENNDGNVLLATTRSTANTCLQEVHDPYAHEYLGFEVA